jgi:N,N'-diacetylchitobiose transport system substrate-binding protein
MKYRYRAIAALAAVLALGVATATAAQASGQTLTVWLQVDAQNGWPNIVAAANQAFEQSHPGWTVNVDYQTWPEHLGKFDATIAGNGAGTPDVIEMGNTEMTKYMAAGEFAPLGSYKSQLDNSSKWLAGLQASSTYNHTLYGVPYYAGSRVITYRADLFAKAGIHKVPRSLAQFEADLVKVGNKEKGVKGFAPLYVGGEDWYTALGWVFDYGGSIATQKNGAWHGTLDSKKSIAGLTAFKQFFDATQPKSSSGLNGTNPFPYTVFSQDQTAANYGPAWYTCCTGTKYKAVTKQFVMPSHTRGLAMPGFLGGSDLAVPTQSPNKAAAVSWIADFTSTANEKALQAKGNIPNATNLLSKSVNDEAASRSWFVPQATNWVNVENGNILRTMLGAFLSGRLSVAQAARIASDNITLTLNQP